MLRHLFVGIPVHERASPILLPNFQPLFRVLGLHRGH